MGELLSRAYRSLRSRRLALILLLVCAGWALLGTVVPQAGDGSEKVSSWAAANPVLEALAAPLGLHDVYASWPFLFVLGLLGVSTIACSVERTKWALRASRAADTAEAVRRRLTERPDATVAVETASPDLAAALRRMGLKVRTEGDVVVGDGGRLGVFGSPLFHWSLAALFVVVALGQLTRSEALIGIPTGGRKVLEASQYGTYDAGPLYSWRYPGLSMEVVDFKRLYEVGGVQREDSPRVRLYSGDAAIADQWVYANNPLRYGSLMIHQVEYGVAPSVSVIASGGAVVGSSAGLSDWSDSATYGVTPVALELVNGDPAAPPIDVEISLVAAREGTAVVRAIPPPRHTSISWTVRGSGVTSTAVIVPGESIPVPGGDLRLDAVTYYARLSVVDDWSVYPIYALFFLATVGLALALLVPRRAAWVIVSEVDGSRVAAVVTRHWRGDPVFRSGVIEEIERLSPGAGSPDERG
ncbi:MAG: cytochrome c biogenesis protein ResB [Coriobacteriia bacterium]|nr:cytochrome c biogenesis protein ResB [Coriobacteriia bacterium]